MDGAKQRILESNMVGYFEIIGLLIIPSPLLYRGIHAHRTGGHGKKMITNQCLTKKMIFIMIFTRNQKSQ
jgi:hypothetical protein